MAGNRTIFASGRLDINWDEGAIRILLSGPQGEVSKEVRRRATAVQKRAKRAAPFKTGELRREIHVNTRYPSEGAVADISSEAPHALVIEFGRGTVRPKKENGWLVWEGDFQTVFAKESRGVEGVHYMERALDAFDD